MIAIIPARGGSKGLPGKNTKLLHGKPLISYTIEAARAAKSITEVYVSTEDSQIAEVSRQYGASVPFLRPASLATDESAAVDAYLFHINKLESDFGKKVDNIVVLLPTSPLRTADDIDAAIKLFAERGAESVISYTREHHPIAWHKYVNDDLRFENIWLDDALKNRQTMRSTFFPNGAIYVFRRSLLEQRKYYSDRSYAYLMPKSRSIDIDTEEDFQLAHLYLTHAS